MRALFLAAIVLVPSAAAWSVSVDAPGAASSGLPFWARVCVDGPVGESADVRVALVAPGAKASGKYGPALMAGACRDERMEPEDVEGDLTLVATARHNSTRVEAQRTIELRREFPVHLRVVEVRAAPFAAVVVENVGNDAPLANVTFAGARIGNGTLAAGARTAAQLGMVPKGNVSLMLSKLALDRVTLPPLKNGQTWLRGAGIRPVGRTDVDAAPIRVEGTLIAFATPEAGAAPVVDLLDGAQREILLEAYTLTSPEIAAALGRALDRGVEVRALIEGSPVGGVSAEERGLAAALRVRGANVSFLAGDASFPARYQTLHAKTIVVDRERVLVSSENWASGSYPPAGGPVGTRGFGVIVGNATLARIFAGVFDVDDGAWPDVRPVGPLDSPATLAGRHLVGGPMLALSGAWNVTPVFAPEASWALADAINATTSSVDAEELFAEPSSPFVDALVSAARRNVSVRLLLDGHVDDGSNRALVDALDARAARESLPLAARVDDAPRTLHAKAVVLDERAVYVGSMNWGAASATRNREAGLIVASPELARWLEGWMRKEWEGAPSLGRSVPGAPILCALLIAFSLRRAASSSRPRS